VEENTHDNGGFGVRFIKNGKIERHLG
jgi:hypothetical protein